MTEIERPEWLAQMEGILQTLNEGVIISDDCEQIIFANSCFLQMLGVEEKQLLGRHPTSLYPGEDAQILKQEIAKSRSKGEHRFEFHLPRKNSTGVPVVVGTRVLEDPDGREFSIVTCTDITEQKQAESALRSANEMLAKRHEEMEQELLLAARVQQSLAPQSLMWGGVAVEAHYNPARTIGGDFGLVTPNGDDQLNLVVCDVSGHGITSALVANRVHSELVSHLRRRDPLSTMLRELNRFVLQSLGGSSLYFTLAAARLEDRGKRLVFAGAGHPPAMILRSGAPTRQLESRSSVLGLIEDAVGGDVAEEVPLESGDRIALYTDGLTEVFNQNQEMLEVEGLQKIFEESAPLPLPEMKLAVLDRVAQWRDGPASDDVSLVLVEIP
ncbi:MAG: SpoIIE family protein phosphatase [Candidatus Acidiferrales bacterium]